MKQLLATIAALGILGACSTDMIVSMQHDKCSQIGYLPGSPDYLACVERGTIQTQAAQDAALASAASNIATGLAYGAIFGYY